MTIRDQLFAVRSALVGLTAQVDVLLEATAPAVEAACPHPREQRKRTGGFGGADGFFCGACEQQFIDEPAATPASDKNGR